MAPPLPQELLDHIVDFLSDDRAASVACRLAGRSMVERTRFHLFRSVALLDMRRYLSFERLMETTRIARCVRKLTLTQVRPHENNQVDRELLRIVERLPNAVYLSMELWNPEDMSADMWAELPTCLARIQVLRIDRGVSFSKARFLEFLEACSGLRKLDMTGWTSKKWQGPQDAPPRSIKALETLSLGQFHLPIACNLEFDAPPRRLEIAMGRKDICSHLQIFLVRCGAGVQHLSLLFDPMFESDGHWAAWHDNQTLELTPNLVSFKLQTFIMPMNQFPHRMSPSLHGTVLRKITERHGRLRRLGLALHFRHLELLSAVRLKEDGEEQARSCHYAKLDAELVRIAGSHPDLEVEFEILCVDDGPLLECQRHALDIITRGLPTFLATETRVRVVVGSTWQEDSVFEGRLVGDVVEWLLPSRCSESSVRDSATMDVAS